MKSMLKYATAFVAIFAIFLSSALVADWVLSWSGCIWSSSATFGISFISQLSAMCYVWYLILELHSW
jgi:hypothetical protein